MVNYGVTCPSCGQALKVEISVEKLRVLVSRVGNGRVKPGITEDVPPAAPPPDNGGFRPADPPEHRCPTCGEQGMFIQEVARKSGREFKARKCINRDCPDYNKFIPGTFRWLGQPATV